MGNTSMTISRANVAGFDTTGPTAGDPKLSQPLLHHTLISHKLRFGLFETCSPKRMGQCRQWCHVPRWHQLI
jgi:hypothetical protein